MNVTSDSTRIVEYFIGIVATALIASGILMYSLQEPDRIAYAQQSQLEMDLDQAMTLYAQNCSVCHGLAGEGIGSIPGLNSDALAQMDFNSLEKIISRGLYNTAMPAWALEDGGPLGDYQIGTLVTLIQNGDWQETQDRVVNLGLAPLVPFTTEPEPEILAALEAIEGGSILAQGITLYAQQCVACHGADGVGTSLAPALKDSTVQGQMEEDLERTILNGVPGTLMAGWDNTLTDEEVEALVHLLKNWDQVPDGAIPAPDIPIPVTEESLALGSSLYATSCSGCHGPEGQGTPRAPSLNVKGFLTETGDAAIQQIITLGIPSTAMPAWGDRMTDAEIQAVVGFIRSWEPTAPEVAEPVRGGGPWWRSEGSQSLSGAKGVPPWMRNEAEQVNPSSAFPSGGDASIRTSEEGGLASQQQHQSADGTPAGAYPAFQESPGGQQQGEEHAGIGAAQQQGEAQAGVGAGQNQSESHQSAGGGPPWAQETEELEWWQEIGWQAATLGISVLLLSFLFIGIALRSLSRLPA